MKTIYLSLPLAILLASCSSKKGLNMDETTLPPPEIPISIVQIPVRLYASELERDLNQQLAGVLYEDKNMADDDMMIRAEKAENIRLTISSSDLVYRVPLKLWIRRKVLFSEVEGEGTLAIQCRTRYYIGPDWTLETSTTIEGTEWLRKPVVKLGFADLPVQFIADQVLKSSRRVIANAVDSQIKASFSLRKEVENTWKMLHEPVLMSEEYRTWILLQPQRIYMTPLRDSAGVVEGAIVLESRPEVVIGERPAPTPMNPLPLYSIQFPSTRGFSLNIQAEIPYEEAEFLARESVVGMRYESGKRYVVVEDIKLGKQGNFLKVQTALSGSYRGAIDLFGKPVYFDETGKIGLQDLDVSLQTKNVLHKSLGWLFKGAFRKQVQQNLDYYLEYYTNVLRETIQESLVETRVAPGISLSGNLTQAGIRQVYLTPYSMQVWIQLGGELQVEVKGFR